MMMVRMMNDDDEDDGNRELHYMQGQGEQDTVGLACRQLVACLKIYFNFSITSIYIYSD